MSAAISSGIGAICSRTRRPGPHQTRLTWRAGSTLGMVGAVVAPTRLPALQRGLDGRARGQDGRPQVERVGDVLEARVVGVQREVRHALLDGVELREPGLQTRLVAHHTRVLGHRVAQPALQRAHVLGPVAREEPVDLGPRRAHRGRGSPLHSELRRVGRGRPAGDASVDEQLDERVAAEAVGAVEPARRLADRVEPLDAGGPVVRAHPDAAHRVVRGRRDLDRRRRDVEHLQLQERLEDAREPPRDRLARQVGDVEPDAAVGRAAPLLDLGVGGERDPVAGGQLHALGVVARHEPLAEAIAQDPALAPRRLRDERAGGLLGFDEARRVELHELRIADAGAGLHGQAEGVACVLVPA